MMRALFQRDGTDAISGSGVRREIQGRVVCKHVVLGRDTQNVPGVARAAFYAVNPDMILHEMGGKDSSLRFPFRRNGI